LESFNFTQNEQESNLVVLYHSTEALKKRKLELEENNNGLMLDIQAKDDLLRRQGEVFFAKICINNKFIIFLIKLTVYKKLKNIHSSAL
jgi:hypothetical protein